VTEAAPEVVGAAVIFVELQVKVALPTATAGQVMPAIVVGILVAVVGGHT
jgi:hypothetical protein